MSNVSNQDCITNARTPFDNSNRRNSNGSEESISAGIGKSKGNTSWGAVSDDAATGVTASSDQGVVSNNSQQIVPGQAGKLSKEEVDRRQSIYQRAWPVYDRFPGLMMENIKELFEKDYGDNKLNPEVLCKVIELINKREIKSGTFDSSNVSKDQLDLYCQIAKDIFEKTEYKILNKWVSVDILLLHEAIKGCPSRNGEDLILIANKLEFLWDIDHAIFCKFVDKFNLYSVKDLDKVFSLVKEKCVVKNEFGLDKFKVRVHKHIDHMIKLMLKNSSMTLDDIFEKEFKPSLFQKVMRRIN